MSKRTSLLISGILGSTLAFASIVSGAEYKAYPGAYCKQPIWLASDPGSPELWLTTLANASTTAELSLLCPLVRDSSYISSATIQVYDRHPTQDVHCWIFFEFASGADIFRFDDYEKSTGEGVGVKNLQFGTVQGGETYYAQCQLPRKVNGNSSHLASLIVHEP
jgi:hypothetical protein